jgi:hypothetical protein
MVKLFGVSPLRALLVFCALCFLPARTAEAHPIHMSFTEVRYLDGNRTLQLWVRVFANDFAAAAARKSGIRLGRDSVIDPKVGIGYVLQSVQLFESDGRALSLLPCGVKRMNDMLWFCVMAKQPESLQKTRMRNIIMTELFSDQVNVVQILDGGTRTSRLFVRGDGAKTLRQE